MSEDQSPNKTTQNHPSSSSSRVPSKIGNGGSSTNFSGQKGHYQNPPDALNPDAATLREQWRFAIRQYSKWYSHAWGTAILAGVSFFALGWIIKGSNPLPSFKHDDDQSPSSSSSSSSAAATDATEARR